MYSKKIPGVYKRCTICTRNIDMCWKKERKNIVLLEIYLLAFSNYQCLHLKCLTCIKNMQKNFGKNIHQVIKKWSQNVPHVQEKIHCVKVDMCRKTHRDNGEETPTN